MSDKKVASYPVRREVAFSEGIDIYEVTTYQVFDPWDATHVAEFDSKKLAKKFAKKWAKKRARELRKRAEESGR